jgi:hypothetical protein
MPYAASILFVNCPSCGAQVMLTGMLIDREPEHPTKACSSGGKLIEAKKDQTTGKMVAEVAKPA